MAGKLSAANRGKHWTELFWPKVERKGQDECWPWLAARHKNGYGALNCHYERGTGNYAHRASWVIHNGDIPNGMWVLHKCDNPPCVNPGHLWLGTHLENMADMSNKGRSLSGERHLSRTHPERVPRGDKHYRRLNPEKGPRGDTHRSRTRPDSIQRGEQCSIAKLTEAQVRDIRLSVASGKRVAHIANDYPQVSKDYLYSIVHMRAWKHVTETEHSNGNST